MRTSGFRCTPIEKQWGTFAFALVFVFTVLPAVADEPHLSNPALSGLATTALVRAYEASGIGSDDKAPLRLGSFVVTIYKVQNNFLIGFTGTTTMEVHNIVVDGHTGSVLWRAGDPSGEAYGHAAISEAFMLPGVVAGEIIAAHQAASNLGYKPFQTGAYYTIFQPWPGATFIAFDQTQEPTSVSTSPGPTPTPDASCHSGCTPAPGYLVPGYTVMVTNGRVTIQPDVNL